MEKSRYFKPEITICEVEASTNYLLVPTSSTPADGPTLYPDSPQDPRGQTYSNEDLFTDIWGNEF